MDSFKVDSIRIKTTREKAFRYISDPMNLPEWTSAFKQVQYSKATVAAPVATLEVGLCVKASASEGTIDWQVLPVFHTHEPPFRPEPLQETLASWQLSLRHEVELVAAVALAPAKWQGLR